jgi:hypothetical protein
MERYRSLAHVLLGWSVGHTILKHYSDKIIFKELIAINNFIHEAASIFSGRRRKYISASLLRFGRGEALILLLSDFIYLHFLISFT